MINSRPWHQAVGIVRYSSFKVWLTLATSPLSLSLWLSPSFFLSISFSLTLSISFSLSLSLALSPALSPFLSLSLFLSLFYMPVFFYISLHLTPSVYPLRPLSMSHTVIHALYTLVGHATLHAQTGSVCRGAVAYEYS